MLSQTKLANKLMMAFTALCVILLGTGIVGYGALQDAEEKLVIIGETQLPGVRALADMQEVLSQVKSVERTLQIRSVARQKQERQLSLARGAWELGEKSIKVLEVQERSPNVEKAWQKFHGLYETWREKNTIFFKQYEAWEKSDSVLDYDTLSNTHWNDESEVQLAAVDALKELTTLYSEEVESSYKAAISEGSSAMSQLIALTAIGVLIAIMLTLVLRTNIVGILNGLSAETRLLTEAAIAGRLSTRGNPEKINFEFRSIIVGINETLDAVIGPLNVAADYVDRISHGNLPPRITDPYNGDFNTIKNNLNTCIDAINALTQDAALLSRAAVEGKLATRADASRHNGDFRRIVQGVNETLDAVIGPLNVAATYVDRISRGDIPPKITDNYNGDFNTIKNNLNSCIHNLSMLVSELNKMAREHEAGDIDVKIDVALFQGAYQTMAQGVNDNVFGHIAVKKKAMHVFQEFGLGHMDANIDPLPGKKRFINDTIEQVRANIKALVADASMLSKAAVEGKLATRADASRHHGDFRKIVQGVNETLDAVIGPLNVAATYVDRISRGDIPPKITDSYNGDFNTIKNNLNTCIDAISALVSDASLLSKAAVEGKLATRANATRHQGDYHKIVQGVNDTLDAVIGPLNVAASYVDRIAKGDIPPKITDSYQGDFNTIKNNLNTCIDAINALVQDADMLSKAAVEGKLSTRADATRHNGDYRKIVSGVNATLNAVIGPLNVAAMYVDRIAAGDVPSKITDSYNGDFNTIKNNLNTCIDAITALVSDASLLSRAAVEGKLATRADATRHKGDYRKIVEGVNETLDAVIGPLNVAADYVARIARGEIPNKITEHYNGEFNTIKNNLNLAIDNINAMVEDANMLAQAAISLHLNTRADANRHQGDYRRIVDGVNRTLDAILTPITQSATQLAAASEELSAVSHQVASNSEETSVQASTVSTAADRVSKNIQTVASATEEMTSSIKEIAKNASESARVATEAVKVAENTNVTVSKLGESSEEIGKVIKVITRIAEQTNLLALNATIEAARAGESGKGFAVVANEVKELAKETARATEDISHKIEAIQGDTRGAVAAIHRIGEIINSINSLSISIATAVEEQTATTNEISRNVVEASNGSLEIARNMVGVAEATKSTTHGAADSQKAAAELSTLASRLQKLVS